MEQEKLLALRARANSLPLEPGVYIMKDVGGNIIYIGKAKLLKNRVVSYFRSIDRHLPKVRRMVEHIERFDYIVTDSEFEALVLECSLIKLHTPKYNILLKDDKGYSYIKISAGAYPRLTAEYRNEDPAARYIGPYISSAVTKQTVEEACKAFGLPTCGRRFPEDIGKARPCLNYHIKQCMGVCSGRISQEAYMEAFNDALAFIDNGGARSVELLTERMQEASDALDFEYAARCRDRIAAIERISEQQKVFEYNHRSLDVIGAVQGEEIVYISVLVLREGRLVDKRDYCFDCFEPLEQSVSEFILSYYNEAGKIPAELFLGFALPDGALLAERISGISGKKLTVTVPQKGRPLELVEMAKNNAAQQLAIRSNRTGRELSALTELGRILGLSSPPEHIEAYDISNFGGQTIVGGMIVYTGGRPDKRLYKKFTIKEQEIPDDCAAMRQMLSRRFDRYLSQDAKDGFELLPDLILMDGGAAQISAAEEVLAQRGLSVPVFGMVKDSRHRTRAVTSHSGELSISANRQVFSLVTAIQDEVHRYAISFSRKSHSAASLATRLTRAEGIGDSRARALLATFKTWKALCAATVEQLAAAEGMSRPAAEKLYAFLHADD